MRADVLRSGDARDRSAASHRRHHVPRDCGTDRRLITHLVISEGPRFPWLTEFYHREIMSRGKALIASVLERGEARGEFRADGLKAYPEILMAPTRPRPRGSARPAPRA
jgi:hypothetical protein